jgi:hypothetical protein
MKLFTVTLMAAALSLCATAPAVKAKGTTSLTHALNKFNDLRDAFHASGVAHGRGRMLCNHEIDCAGELACVPQQKSGGSLACAATSTSGLCNGREDCGKGKSKTHRCVGKNHTHAGTCQPKAAMGEACDTDKDDYDNILSHTYSAQCPAKTAYCKAGVCAALEPAGTACSDGLKCDGYCDGSTLFGGEDGTCKAYKKNGEKCTKPDECGGTDPPYSWGACSVKEGASEGECVDVGEEIEGFFKKLLGVFIAIIIAAVLAIVGCIYCCCCRKKAQVVVVAQPVAVVA